MLRSKTVKILFIFGLLGLFEAYGFSDLREDLGDIRIVNRLLTKLKLDEQIIRAKIRKAKSPVKKSKEEAKKEVETYKERQRKLSYIATAKAKGRQLLRALKENAKNKNRLDAQVKKLERDQALEKDSLIRQKELALAAIAKEEAPYGRVIKELQEKQDPQAEEYERKVRAHFDIRLKNLDRSYELSIEDLARRQQEAVDLLSSRVENTLAKDVGRIDSLVGYFINALSMFYGSEKAIESIL